MGSLVSAAELDGFYNQSIVSKEDGKWTYSDGSYLIFNDSQAIEFHKPVDRRVNYIIDQKTAKQKAFRMLEYVPNDELKELVFDDEIEYTNNTYYFKWFGYVNNTYVLDSGIDIDIKVDGNMLKWKYTKLNKNIDFAGNLSFDDTVKIAEDNSFNMTGIQLDNNMFLDNFEAIYNGSLSRIIMMVGDEGQKYSVVDKKTKNVYYPDNIRIPSPLKTLDKRFFWIRMIFDSIMLYVVYRLFFKN